MPYGSEEEGTSTCVLLHSDLVRPSRNIAVFFLVTKGATEDIGVTPRAAHCRELAPLTP